MQAAETQVGDDSLPTLRGMTGLRDLSLYRTRATEEAIERLADARPDMQVSGAPSVRVPTR